MSQKETRIVMRDFTDKEEAKALAIFMIDADHQFAFSPEPMCISYRMAIKEVVEEDQPTTA